MSSRCVSLPRFLRRGVPPAHRALGLAVPLVIASLAAPARADHTTGGVAGGAAGPINAVPAGTLPEGMWAMSLRFDLIDLNKRSNAQLQQLSAAGIDVHSTDREDAATLSVAYGLHPDVTVGASVPYLALRNLREADGAGGIEHLGDVEGMGDLSLFGQVRVLNETMADDTGTMEVAVLGGLKLPTGADREHADGELLETEHQPSPHTIEPFAGVAATRSFDHASLTADAIYLKATQGTQRTNTGDVLKYDLAWGYRLSDELKHEHIHEDGSVHMHGSADRQWDLVVELNGAWHESVDVDGDVDGNTGGNVVLLSPGVRLTTTNHMSWFASYGLPVIDNVHGLEHKTDGVAVLGMSWTF